MSSVVDICNLALSHLGDTASVTSIDPPEGSAQAEHCARFYPIARDSLLEMHDWKFASKRALLAELTSETDAWDYAYAMPSDALRIISVTASDADDDNASSNLIGTYSAQPYAIEVISTGAMVIYTDQEDAAVRYTAYVTDSGKFSPLFTMTLSAILASLLAGPIIKGDSGAAEAKRCAALAQAYLAKAAASDAQQRGPRAKHSVSWIANR
jgi:hypothetical protein